MARKTMKRVQGDITTEMLQRNTEDFVRASIPEWIGEGVMLRSIYVAAGPTVISHTLLRQPLGWVLTDNITNGNVWRIAWTASTITLQSSVATTVNIWVF